jgi:hypothetical protein
MIFIMGTAVWALYKYMSYYTLFILSEWEGGRKKRDRQEERER